MAIRNIRALALAAPLLMAAAIASAEPAQVSVTLGPQVEEQIDELGRREIERQTGRLADVIRRELSRHPEFDGASVDLTLSDLKPNRPTMEQLRQRPGLDPLRSVSIGGADIEGQVRRLDGTTRQVSARYFSTSLADVWSLDPWADAEKAYQRAATKIARNP